jgi:hypothetical protein
MKVKGILDKKIKANKEIDFYIPIRITYEDNDDKEKELFYYRLLNLKSSFVEILISSTTKRIVRVAVVSINDIVEVDQEVMEKLEFVGELGNPEIDMALFEQEHIITDNTDFKVMRHEKKIYIICDSGQVDKKLIMDNLDILLDNKGNMVGYIFSGFTEWEWNEINESIDSSISVTMEHQRD